MVVSLTSIHAPGEHDADSTRTSEGGLPWWGECTVWAATVVTTLGGCILGFGYLRFGRPGDAMLHQLLLVLPVVGAVLATRCPRSPIGWIFLLSGAAQCLGGAIIDDRFAIMGHGTASAWAIVAESAFWPLGFPLMVVSLFWFPDGHLLSRRWAPAAAGVLAVVATLTVLGIVSPFDAGQYPGLRNPVGITALRAVGPFARALTIIVLPLALGAVVSIGLRYRRGEAETRTRIRWIVWIVVVQLLAIAVQYLVDLAGDVPEWLVGTTPAPIVVGLPIVVAIAVVRHRLLDIDLLINRTVLYSALSAVVVGTYAVAVAGIGRTTGRSDWLPTMAVALVVAIALQPLRNQLQRLLDRRLFGQRHDPLSVLASLSVSASTSSAPFDELVGAIAQSLRLHHVALDVCHDDGGHLERVAVFGSARGAPIEEVPMFDGRHMRGRLVVARRSPHEPLRRDEFALLAAIATNAAWLLRSELLTGELQRARERLVTAAEDERRRLRRDLHDGLGSRLTGISYQVEATRLAVTPGMAADASHPLVEGLEQTKADLADAVTELRRIIDDLRPGALDDLGLVRALSSDARRTLGAAGVEYDLQVDLTEQECSSLSAAAEVVLYRVGVEAITNVARHARARRCCLTLCVASGEVVMTVEDDGIGLNGEPPCSPDRPGSAGVGLRSMRQRAEELGGLVLFTARHGGGTRVTVQLPVAAS
ncbi:MAG: histidine kinase [Acidimicrobiales bacterium]|jgi:signal transduction histidine kinase